MQQYSAAVQQGKRKHARHASGSLTPGPPNFELEDQGSRGGPCQVLKTLIGRDILCVYDARPRQRIALGRLVYGGAQGSVAVTKPG